MKDLMVAGRGKIDACVQAPSWRCRRSVRWWTSNDPDVERPTLHEVNEYLAWLADLSLDRREEGGHGQPVEVPRDGNPRDRPDGVDLERADRLRDAARHWRDGSDGQRTPVPRRRSLR